ncbi:hypothetical protein SLEP1_g24712 [Rubroshorea leprosula]|uniref:Transposase (putative) gypsy type domain-containing protein n=1 Tax=Rubroshorea leprosula TaxID=152421 RepID=A0AAV5JQY1_9ROSI|nr:hypothetical protein SLEP1_g24712 [Rubroshorea leprosula]
MFFGDFGFSEEFDCPLTFSDLDLSPLKEVRFKNESDIECELEFIEDPDCIPPSTPCSESYETEEMSSKETLSVEGSEEVRMVAEVSIRTESFGSERTVVEVRVEEMVEGEGIPLNILEAEGTCERCYDVEVDIVSEVVGYETKWLSRDSLIHIVETYDLPHQVLIRLVGVEERACLALRNHWMPLYAHYLAVGLRFPILELLVGLLSKYSIGLTQLAPNAMNVVIGFLVYCRARGVRVHTINMFKPFFVLKGGSTKEKDKEEDVEKLVKEWDDVVDIMYLTNSDAMEAVEIYGANSLSEEKMDKFLATVGGMVIPKKARKKLKTSITTIAASQKGEVGREKGQPSSTSVRVSDIKGLRPELKWKGSEDVRPAQKRMRQGSLFDTKSMTATKRFINSTFLEVDHYQAREKVLSDGGVEIVKHVLKKFFETLKERNVLVKEKEELGKKKDEVEKDLAEVMPELKQL